MRRRIDIDLPYGPENRFANSLNRAWNYNRNPLYQYYRFPWESLFVSLPARELWWRLLIAVALFLSPLLSGIPFVWMLCKIDFSAVVVMLLFLAVYQDPRPVSERTQLGWQTTFLHALATLMVLVPVFAIGAFFRAIHWPH